MYEARCLALGLIAVGLAWADRKINKSGRPRGIYARPLPQQAQPGPYVPLGAKAATACGEIAAILQLASKELHFMAEAKPNGKPAN
eukprot:scaffold449832_cov17-Prasinocladus_malaysianus.AAC.1